MTGNYNAMQMLLDNLKRRENWPEEFIRALEECEHADLAQEMKEEYEKLKPSSSKEQHTHTHTIKHTHIYCANMQKYAESFAEMQKYLSHYIVMVPYFYHYVILPLSVFICHGFLR